MAGSLLALLVFCLTLVFLASYAPLALALTLVAQGGVSALCITLIRGCSSWFSYLLFMYFLSGIIILFIYVSSISSNESYSGKRPLQGALVVTFAVATGACFYNPAGLEAGGLSLSLFSSPPAGLTSGLDKTILKVFSADSAPLTLFLTAYLLVTLLVVVYNSRVSKGPLRAVNSSCG